jgi:hypothetical protein
VQQRGNRVDARCAVASNGAQEGQADAELVQDGLAG